MERRTFLGVLTGLFHAAVTLVAGIPAIAYLLDPLRRTGQSPAVRAKRLAEIAVGVPQRTTLAAEVRDGWAKAAQPMNVWVIRGAESEADPKLTVFSGICPHSGCPFDFAEPDKCFRCPCHGAEFSLSGEVVKQPSPRPLDQLETRVTADGWVEVVPRKFRSGTAEKIAT
jgi:Rieske Fe-S protein